jgi:methylenetetrahydrofolate dehydrogenase (NADP+)/methenyltetrahydrofolate cyclohydrolase
VQTRIIDGNAIARELRVGLTPRVAALAAMGMRPGLAVLQVGNHPASRVYVRSKMKACGEAGLYSEHIELPADADESALLGRIRILNHDTRIHGILVQLPLPADLSAERVVEALAPAKDVDGFHPTNMGMLAVGNPRFVPCTSISSCSISFITPRGVQGTKRGLPTASRPILVG